MYPAIGSSKRESSFGEDLQEFIRKYIALWQISSEEIPGSATLYSTDDQHKNGRDTEYLINSMEEALRKYPGREPQQSAWRDRAFASLRQFGTVSLRLPERHCNIIFSPEYLATTRAFIHRGRAFNPRMETAAFAQALRNVWVMNCLQMFLGRKPALSPSIFAYSMLYPYTDNFLDRPNLPLAAKEIACRRLSLRLSGLQIASGDEREASVFQLIEIIESEFPRTHFPEVYLSLLAIHEGQVQSLRQQSRNAALDERQMLCISVAKGGSSVLADGWLVAGKLDRPEADFFFGYGVLLQLMDDLQDLAEDRAAGHRTLFNCAETPGQLARLTNRLWAFMDGVMNTGECFIRARGLELRDLIRHNCAMLILRAVAECAEMYPGDYVRHMQKLSPLSFEFLRNQGREFKARFDKIWPSLARRRKLHSPFDLMG